MNNSEKGALSSKLWANEQKWLESIGSIIKKTELGILVENPILSGEDFNYLFLTRTLLPPLLKQITQKYIKVHFGNLDYIEKIKSKEIARDVSFIKRISQKTLKDLENSDKEIYLKNYSDKGRMYPRNRIFNESIKFYQIFYRGEAVGEVCLVIYENILGIYDFEIYKNYRQKGIASFFFQQFSAPTRNEKEWFLFLQTWSENKVAISLYEKAGFEKHEEMVYCELEENFFDEMSELET